MRTVSLVFAVLLAAPAWAQELVTTVRASRPNADGQTKTRIETRDHAGEARHAGTLAAEAPGALTLDFGGPLASSTLSLRGGSADQVAVFIDGVPLGSPSGGGVDLSRIPAALLSGVEVQRGADARLGASAMGGSLRLEPVQGTRVVLTAGSLRTGGLSASHVLELDGQDSLWRVTAAADVRSSRGDFGYSRDPTPEIIGNDALIPLGRANNDALLGSALARVERHAEDQAMTGLVLFTAGERGLPGPIYSPTPDTRQRDWALLTQLGWSTPGIRVPAFVRTGQTTTFEASSGESRDRQTFVDIATSPSFTLPLDFAEVRIDALAGHERFRGESHGERERTRAGAGVVVAQESGRWSGSFALRGEVWGDAWSVVPRAGGRVRLTRGLSLHANAGAGFRPPSFSELYFSEGPLLPNPDLVAERAWSGDLALSFTGTADAISWDAQTTLFGGLYEDTIIYELFSGTRAKPFNLAGSRALGVEAEVKVSPAHGPLRPLRVTLTGSWLNTRSLVEGANAWHKTLPYRPEWRGKIRAAWQTDTVRAAIDFASTSSAWANRANTRLVDGFRDLAASAGVRLFHSFWLGAEVRNALDHRDRAVIEGYPLPGRLVFAHLSWEPEPSP